MDLYHIHLKGTKDEKWKSGKELVVGPNFTNRLGNKVNDFNCYTSTNGLESIVNEINNVMTLMGYAPFDKTVPISEIIMYLISKNITDIRLQRKILTIAQQTLNNSNIFKREMAMENYRKDNNIKAPSRQHCIYAFDEKGVDYWLTIFSLENKEFEAFRIEPIEAPFQTNEIFIPSESSNYEKAYQESYKYWNPKLKKIDPVYDDRNEYLIKGKVKILEKIL